MSYEFTKLSNVPAVSEFPEGANAIIETNGEIKRCPPSNVPKPLTYDYMPEGYPKKEQSETVIVENQTISGFQENTSLGVYIASNSVMQEAISNKYPENIPTIKILWDGTEYECQYIHAAAPVNLAYGNTSLLGVGEDTGEPFLISMSEPLVISKTPGDSHEIKVSAVTENITPMAEEFLPNIPADKLPANTKNTTVFYS